MLIVCPSCQHAIRLTDLRPGRFTPQCPRCRKSFQITIFPEHARTPVVSTLEPSAFAEPVHSEAIGERPAAMTALEWPEITNDLISRDRWLQRLPRGLPRFLGDEILFRLLGHGPRGQAALARPWGVGEAEVVKLPAEDRTADRVFLARFLREAFAASAIAHPNLVAIREIAESRGRHYVALERVEGCSVADLLKERGKLDPCLAAVITLQAARGLAAAHEQGLWHRDVKPENLRLDRDGLVKVDDLGLEMTPSLARAMEAKERKESADAGASMTMSRPASITRSMEASAVKETAKVVAAVGSPLYMAPEQADDAVKIDGRADIYSLGCTFYQMVTGRPPFPGDNALELARKHQEESPVPAREFAPGLPRAIADAIQTMMRTQPNERYPSMAVTAEALERVIGLESEAAEAERTETGAVVRQAAEEFDATPTRQLRFRILAMAGGVWLAFMALLVSLGLIGPAIAIFALGTLTVMFMASASGFFHNSTFVMRCFEAIRGQGMRRFALAAVLILCLVSFIGYFYRFQAIILILGAGGLAAAFHHFLTKPVADHRDRVMRPVWDAIRRLRARGHDEQTIASLVVENGRPAGLRFVETALRGASQKPLDRESGNFSPIWSRGCEKIDFALCFPGFSRNLIARKLRAMRRLLEAAETGRLAAAGWNELTARRKAKRTAKAMVIAAEGWRDEQRLIRKDGTTPTIGPPLLERLNRAADQPEPFLQDYEPQRSAMARRIESASRFLFGRPLRLALGLALFGLLAYALDRKEILTFAEVRFNLETNTRVLQNLISQEKIWNLRHAPWMPLISLSRLDRPLLDQWLPWPPFSTISGTNLLTASMLLIISILSGRRLTGFFAILAACVALFGPYLGLWTSALPPKFDAQAQACLLGGFLLVIGPLLSRFLPRRNDP